MQKQREVLMQEINLYDLMRYYAKNWLNLLGALFVGAIIGVAYTGLIQTPLYKSEATMIVTGRTSAADTTTNNNYAELFKSRLVLETVVREKGYNGSYEQLLARTTAVTDKNTDVLKVSIADPDPKTSQLLLTASVDTFKERASNIFKNSENIKSVDTASLPSKPFNVKTVMQVGLAMAATFFAAIIALFFVYDYKNSNPARTRATEKRAKKTSRQAKKNNTSTTDTDAKKATVSSRTKNVNTPAADAVEDELWAVEENATDDEEIVAAAQPKKASKQSGKKPEKASKRGKKAGKSATKK
ncbi:hypothetical protein KI440_02720 [Candidatus Saccharibacteria bacterium TM7i]|nr:hypothetical protein KI440_02720 [Candidatus Saccharibacteria bacterium TM7i]